MSDSFLHWGFFLKVKTLPESKENQRKFFFIIWLSKGYECMKMWYTLLYISYLRRLTTFKLTYTCSWIVTMKRRHLLKPGFQFQWQIFFNQQCRPINELNKVVNVMYFCFAVISGHNHEPYQNFATFTMVLTRKGPVSFCMKCTNLRAVLSRCKPSLQMQNAVLKCYKV